MCALAPQQCQSHLSDLVPAEHCWCVSPTNGLLRSEDVAAAAELLNTCSETCVELLSSAKSSPCSYYYGNTPAPGAQQQARAAPLRNNETLTLKILYNAQLAGRCACARSHALDSLPLTGSWWPARQTPVRSAVTTSSCFTLCFPAGDLEHLVCNLRADLLAHRCSVNQGMGPCFLGCSPHPGKA